MPEPVFGLALVAKEKKDEVKLTAGLAKIIEEDPVDIHRPRAGHGADDPVGAG